MLDTIALLLTATGVCVGAWQLRSSQRLALTAFEDSVDQQYRALAATIPMDVWLARTPPADVPARTREAIFRYFDLCNEQVFLRRTGRVSSTRWVVWEDGIRHHMRVPAIDAVWTEVVDGSSGYFGELERLLDSVGRGDPKSWKRR